MKTLLILGALAALAGFGTARADDIPAVKSGLWEARTTHTNGGKTMNVAVKICQSVESQKKDQEFAAQLREKNKCSGSITQASPGVYVSDFKCAAPGTGSTSKSTLTFEGSDAYKLEVHITTAARESVMISESKYLGACPADMKPGDTVMENTPK